MEMLPARFNPQTWLGLNPHQILRIIWDGSRSTFLDFEEFGYSLSLQGSVYLTPTMGQYKDATFYDNRRFGEERMN